MSIFDITSFRNHLFAFFGFVFSVSSVSVVFAGGPSWEAGVKGGIPWPTEVHSVTDFGAVGDGFSDDTSAFQAALNALPPGGGVVLVPGGTFLLSSTILLRDNSVLRGAGAAHTHLKFDLGGRAIPAIEVSTYDRGDWVNVNSGFVSGSTEIGVGDSSSFTVPTFAEIEQANDPDIMYTQASWDQSWADQSVGEVVRVIGKNGSQLVLEKPLNFTYDPAMNPRIRTQGLIEYAGIEDLHINRIDSGDGDTILFKNAAWVWVRGVESEMTYRAHIHTWTVYGCQVQGSYFHHAHDYGQGGHGYGINMDRHTTGCLVEDNIFFNLRHSMMMQVGASGNVYGYNYSKDPVWNQTDISFHGHYPGRNLVEGNVVQNVGLSDWWGPAGPDNTLLRNCILTKGIRLMDYSHGQNLIGNVLPPGPTNIISIAAGILNTYMHGNVVDGNVQWDQGSQANEIPVSFYLSEKPLFFGSTNWPSIGFDVDTLACTNPALDRWLSGNPTPESWDPNNNGQSATVFADEFEDGDLSEWTIVR